MSREHAEAPLPAHPRDGTILPGWRLGQEPGPLRTTF